VTSAIAYQRRRLRAAYATRSTEATAAPRLGRRLVAGILLAAAVAGAHLLPGRLPGAPLPAGWSSHALVTTTGGARYVALDGQLHPVLNGLSARLALPVGYPTYTVDAATLAGLPLGAPIGIADLPEEVGTIHPADRWWACLNEAGSVSLTLGGRPPAGSWSAAVRVEERVLVLSEGLALPLSKAHESATLRALGLDARTPLAAPPTWVALFRRGATLAPLELPGAGADAGLTETATGAGALTVGAIVGIPSDPRRYVVTSPGRLALLTPLALAMYQVGGGGSVRTMSAEDLASAETDTTAVSPADWPTRIGDPVDGSVCAVLAAGDGTVTLVPGPPTPPQGSGTLAHAAEATYLLTGHTAYPLPEPPGEVTARLGWASKDAVTIPATWLALFARGAPLDPVSAGPRSRNGIR
jgi:hypothetical protein